MTWRVSPVRRFGAVATAPNGAAYAHGNVCAAIRYAFARGAARVVYRASIPCPDCGQGWPDGCAFDCPSRDE